MTPKHPRRTFAPLVAIALGCMATLAAPVAAPAMQILDAADHAELAAHISSTGVNRIALSGDRIARVVRSPDGFAVEHDAVSGDLYLRPLSPEAGMHAEPVTLFVGTERGFTYRLTLTPAERGSAQILIRNAETAAGTGPVPAGGPHVAALVRLVRAVARRETVPGYAIVRGGGTSPGGMTVIETWRGPRLAAHVLEADRDAPDAAGLARTIGAVPGIDPAAEGARLAALWLAAPGTGPGGGRLVVAVTQAASAGEPR